MFKFVCVFALIAAATAIGTDDEHAEIKLLKSDVRADGFDHALETSNGISSSASGDEHGNIHGEFSWVDPKGELIKISYIADENGYQPIGDAIPTRPPIPEAIIRSINYIKAHEQLEPGHSRTRH